MKPIMFICPECKTACRKKRYCKPGDTPFSSDFGASQLYEEPSFVCGHCWKTSKQSRWERKIL